MNTMDQGTQKNAAMVEEQTAASHALAREASALNELLQQFRLSNSAPAAAASPRPAVRDGALEASRVSGSRFGSHGS